MAVAGQDQVAERAEAEDVQERRRRLERGELGRQVRAGRALDVLAEPGRGGCVGAGGERAVVQVTAVRVVKLVGADPADLVQPADTRLAQDRAELPMPILSSSPARWSWPFSSFAFKSVKCSSE
jgi:hypothetical protein